MRRAAIVIVCLGAAALARADVKKPGSAKLEVNLRANPKSGSLPARITFTAELKGGADTEDLYCPTLEWEWDGGSTSTQEGECAPFVAGTTKVERHFTITHEFHETGRHTITVTIRVEPKVLGKATTEVTVLEPEGRSISIRDEP